MVSNIIEEVKKGLTGDPLKDIQYLQEQAAKYKDSPDSAEILKILSDMSFELLPDELLELLPEELLSELLSD